MTMRNCWAKTILVLWCSAQAAQAPGRAVVPPQAKDPTAVGADLAALVRAYRKAPSPESRAAVEAYAAAHPKEKMSAELALGVTAYEQEEFEDAITHLKNVQIPQIADYVGYYLAAARVGANQTEGVAADVAAVQRTEVPSPLAGKAWMVQAQGLQTDAPVEAVKLLRDHYADLPQPDGDLALAEAYQAAKDLPHAAEFYQRVYYEYVSGDAAEDAAAALVTLKDAMGAAYPQPLPAQAMRRADRLLEARQYAAAKTEYESLLGTLAGRDREQAQVRIGAADIGAGHLSIALPYLRGLQLTEPEADAERLYYEAEAARRMANDEAMMAAVKALAKKYPKSTWRLKATVNAANRWLTLNRPDEYLKLYQDAYENFPNDPSAGVYHWKVAFHAYREDQHDAAELIREQLRNYPTAPSTGAALYFLGRHAEMHKDPAYARAIYERLTRTFPNQFYAMLARDRLKQPEIAGAGPSEDAAKLLGELKLPEAKPLPAEQTRPTALRIERSRLLRAAGLSDMAEGELRYGIHTDGQPVLLGMEFAEQADSAYPALKIMKATAGDYLSLPIDQAPRRYWEMLFPLPYRADLEKDARAQGLDPVLFAGLIRQESEFNPGAQSGANAWGLTQLQPPTARQYAPRAGVPNFTPRQLFQPAVALKIGAAYFKAMLDKHGGNLPQTLAAYNAGPNRLAQWLAWGLTYREPAEFIEMIPFTETRDYVQAVMRNADMYRRLYH
jgi:soluble lytic murein transglycosylase